MKFLHVLSYILLILCSMLTNAQNVSKQDSINIQRAYNSHVLRDKELDVKFWNSLHDSIGHYKLMNALYEENLSIQNVLENYQINYQKGSHWSSMKGDILVDLYKFSLRTNRIDSSKTYKKLVLNSDYIPIKDKIRILILSNHYLLATALDTKTILSNSYQITQYLKQVNNPELEIRHLFFLVRFYTQTKNLAYAEEILKQTQIKVSKTHYLAHYESYSRHSLYLLLAQKKYNKLKYLLPVFKKHQKRISLNFDLALIYFWGLNDLTMAKNHLQLLKDEYGEQNFRPDFILLEAEISLAEKNYSKVLLLIDKAEFRNYVKDRFFKNETHIQAVRLTAAAHEGLHQYKKALAYHKAYKRMEDSIRAIQKEQQFIQANFRLKKDQELQQLAKANLEQELANERSEKKSRLLIFGLIVFMFFGIAGVYYFKSKKKFSCILS